MRVLVTGGAGFVGSHVVESCLENGHELMVVDNLTTGSRDNLSTEVDLTVMDIRDARLSMLFAAYRPEIVIHLAAQIDARASVQAPGDDAQTNVLGTINVLEACRQVGVRRFIYITSAAVYGAPHYLPIDESHPVAPISPYGVSKYVGELYTATYARLHGLETVCLRAANIYGPRQNSSAEGGVVALFVSRLCQGDIPTVHGQGNQTRDFVYVKDVAAAVLSTLQCTPGTTLNISTGEATSIQTLLECIGRLLGRQPQPHYEAARAGDILHSCLDNRRAQAHLAWTPRYSLADGLAATIDWFLVRSTTTYI